MQYSEEQIIEMAVEATKKFIRNLEESDFVSNVGWRSAEELRKYAADIAFDIASIFQGFEDWDKQPDFAEMFKEGF